MKVFISWSGNRSHRVAEILHDWLSLVIQALEPWISSSDIERGSQWASKINEELEATSQGIFCLTAENKDAPWILFEAGSLAKGQATSRVYTLLVDIKAAEITGPLVQFNHTQPIKSDVRLLIGSLNDRLGDKRLPEAILTRSFENAWPKFEADFNQAIVETAGTTPIKDARTEKEILGEILELARNSDSRITKLENRAIHYGPDYSGYKTSFPIPDAGNKRNPLSSFSVEEYVESVVKQKITERELYDLIEANYPETPYKKVINLVDSVKDKFI
jgi:hypothetical protein